MPKDKLIKIIEIVLIGGLILAGILWLVFRTSPSTITVGPEQTSSSPVVTSTSLSREAIEEITGVKESDGFKPVMSGGIVVGVATGTVVKPQEVKTITIGESEGGSIQEELNNLRNDQ